MLSVENLACDRGDFGLSIDRWCARPGSLHAVLGTNGAGKSTLLRLLCRELEPDAGRITLHGRPLASWSPTERARHLGVLPQASTLNFAFSAREVVELGLTPLSLSRRDALLRCRHVMRQTDCEHLAAKAYTSLSGGEHQRVHLARVLLQLSQADQPPVLLLDEPTSAQDLGQQHRLLQLVSSLAHEHHYCVVAILHDLNQAMRYADDCLLLSAGRSVAVGPPGKVVAAETVEQHWGYRPQVLRDANGATVLV